MSSHPRAPTRLVAAQRVHEVAVRGIVHEDSVADARDELGPVCRGMGRGGGGAASEGADGGQRNRPASRKKCPLPSAFRCLLLQPLTWFESNVVADWPDTVTLRLQIGGKDMVSVVDREGQRGHAGSAAKRGMQRPKFPGLPGLCYVHWRISLLSSAGERKAEESRCTGGPENRHRFPGELQHVCTPGRPRDTSAPMPGNLEKESELGPGHAAGETDIEGNRVLAEEPCTAAGLVGGEEDSSAPDDPRTALSDHEMTARMVPSAG